LKNEKLNKSLDKDNQMDIKENISNQNLSKEIIIKDEDMERQISSETNEKSGWWQE